MEFYYNKPGAMPKILYVFMTGHYEVTVRFYLCIIIIVMIIIIYYYYYYILLLLLLLLLLLYTRML